MKEEIITIILGALPITEARAAIIVAMLQFGFSVEKAYFLGVLGNIIPVIPVLFFLNKVSEFLMQRWYLFNRFMTWLFEKFQKRNKDHFASYKWSALALFIFVAVPLPFTGAWSGIIAAHLLGISFWKGVLSISLGIMAAGFIVAIALYLGILGFNAIL